MDITLAYRTMMAIKALLTNFNYELYLKEISVYDI